MNVNSPIRGGDRRSVQPSGDAPPQSHSTSPASYFIEQLKALSDYVGVPTNYNPEWQIVKAARQLIDNVLPPGENESGGKARARVFSRGVDVTDRLRAARRALSAGRRLPARRRPPPRPPHHAESCANGGSWCRPTCRRAHRAAPSARM